MFVTFESTVRRPNVIARHPSFAEAFAAIENRADCIAIEADADHEGCADAFLADGRLLCIEPAARRGL